MGSREDSKYSEDDEDGEDSEYSGDGRNVNSSDISFQVNSDIVPSVSANIISECFDCKIDESDLNEINQDEDNLSDDIIHHVDVNSGKIRGEVEILVEKNSNK
ncbi:unnamed protein product [Rhizophagus irregularis]|nr:unnamed protein product [Rhizophagus irregularis]